MEQQYRHSQEIINHLVETEAISSVMLEHALCETKRTGLDVIKALDSLGYISEEEVAHIEAGKFDIPYLDLNGYKIDKNLLTIFSAADIRTLKILPLFKIEERVTVAMSNPGDVVRLDKLRQKYSDFIFDVVLVSESSLSYAIDHLEQKDCSFADILKLFDKTKHSDKEKSLNDLIEIAGEAPMVKLVDYIIQRAVNEHASDIHIEPCKNDVRIRYRVDGRLNEIAVIPKDIQNALISRVKILCLMDISESRKPQDGRIKIDIDGQLCDLRVSTFPTLYGENIVIRVLNKSSVNQGLKNITADPENIKQLQKLVNQPNGMILVTGPTGSGKTSTLYSILSSINTMDKNIITIEDPIEYELPIIRQTQVNPKAGLTFANGLRNILRQDPDVIMVGEIRDKETAEVATHAALTGHLVLSTVHTNDAIGTIARLEDMGIEKFLIANSLIGVIAQRLVRVICEHCKERVQLEPHMKEGIGLHPEDKIYKGCGCEKCKNTGYIGRTVIFEMLTLDDNIRNIILSKSGVESLKFELQNKYQFKTLRDSGIELVKKGITTLDEVLMVSRDC